VKKAVMRSVIVLTLAVLVFLSGCSRKAAEEKKGGRDPSPGPGVAHLVDRIGLYAWYTPLHAHPGRNRADVGWRYDGVVLSITDPAQETRRTFVGSSQTGYSSTGRLKKAALSHLPFLFTNTHAPNHFTCGRRFPSSSTIPVLSLSAL